MGLNDKALVSHPAKDLDCSSRQLRDDQWTQDDNSRAEDIRRCDICTGESSCRFAATGGSRYQRAWQHRQGTI